METSFAEKSVLIPALDLKSIQAGKKAGNQHGNINQKFKTNSTEIAASDRGKELQLLQEMQPFFQVSAAKLAEVKQNADKGNTNW